MSFICRAKVRIIIIITIKVSGVKKFFTGISKVNVSFFIAQTGYERWRWSNTNWALYRMEIRLKNEIKVEHNEVKAVVYINCMRIVHVLLWNNRVWVYLVRRFFSWEIEKRNEFDSKRESYNKLQLSFFLKSAQQFRRRCIFHHRPGHTQYTFGLFFCVHCFDVAKTMVL